MRENLQQNILQQRVTGGVGLFSTSQVSVNQYLPLTFHSCQSLNLCFAVNMVFHHQPYCILNDAFFYSLADFICNTGFCRAANTILLTISVISLLKMLFLNCFHNSRIKYSNFLLKYETRDK